MDAVIDSQLAGAVGNAEGRRRKAECGRPLRRTGPAGGTHGKPGQAPAVQEIGSRLASSLPYITCNLLVTGRQWRMFLRISVLQGKRPQGH